MEKIEKENEEVQKNLYQAVVDNNVSKVLCLLEQDIDVNWENVLDNNQTALHRATWNGNCIIVALLLGKGAECHKRDGSGQTPLNLALASPQYNKDLISLLANKTVSSLEDAKRRLKQTESNLLLIAENETSQNSPSKSPARPGSAGDINRITSLHRRKQLQYNIPQAQAVDSVTISSQLDQIFETQRSTSIFQNHFPRNSAIIEMLKISHFQTIYNIFVAILLIAFFNTLLYNFYESGTILDFEILVWCFADFPAAILIWSTMFTSSFFAFLLQRAIVDRNVTPRIAYILMAIYIAILYTTVGYIVRLRKMPPATAAFLMCEMVRLSMKMHSYLMVNLSLRRAKEKNDPDPQVKDYPANVTAEDYFQFLWFPTLVYQTSYPRTASIRLSFVVKRLTETGLCVLYTYAIFVRYVVPHMNEMTGGYKELLFATFKVMLPGITVSLLAFYGVLHCWLNAFAELTRFADRHFYSDWWNSTSWGTYYRKWNYVVHKFLHRHIFMDCVVVFQMSKNSAMWITFIISAIVHEYVIAISLGFYKPVMFVMFVIPGVLFIYLTQVSRGSRMWNIFMWTMLIIGHGMLIALYSRAWYFHYHPEKLPHKPEWSWTSLFSVL